VLYIYKQTKNLHEKTQKTKLQIFFVISGPLYSVFFHVKN